MRILGVIPARGGSKGIPRKNLVPLAGKPLMAYTIEAAKGSRLLADIVVSTEDEEIAKISRDLGVPVPFLRPTELATDAARSLPVVQHAVREMERRAGAPYEIIVMLQPTSPLRTAADIDAGIQLLMDSGADSVVSVVDVGGYHPYRMKKIVDENRLVNFVDQGIEDMRPRQELPPVYIRSGALYVSKRTVVMDQNTLVGADCRAQIVSPDRAINIDSIEDLYLAEYFIITRRGHTRAEPAS
ncbi:MAG: acylneuraminate cytidylyltransferase family protein [Nitrospirae bacterium]|nr:acylneuraminate cytidylyltransferase family protein [Nitrospirota bacterium]